MGKDPIPEDQQVYDNRQPQNLRIANDGNQNRISEDNKNVGVPTPPQPTSMLAFLCRWKSAKAAASIETGFDGYEIEKLKIQ